MIEVKINGERRELGGDPATPLLWAIRDALGLTGTKYGCGIGQCGACTVHVNGEATRSCVTQISDVAGAEITTIEGLSTEVLHPLQQAWLDHDVVQCGYCQSGQIMTAVELLAKNPSPTDGDIDEAMSGNICRCGAYSRIRRGIHQAAAARREGGK